MNIHDIKESLVEKVLNNPNAYELVEQKEFTVHESLSSYASYKKISLEDICSIYGFDENMVTNISYTKAIQKSFPEYFKIIKGRIKRQHRQTALKEEMSDKDGSDLKKLLSENTSDLFNLLTVTFPSLRVYKVPNNNLDGNKKRNFLLFFPNYIGTAFDYPMIQFLKETGFSGSTVIRLPIGEGEEIVFALLENKQIDGIINFYSDGASQENWYSFEYILCHNLPDTEKNNIKLLLKDTPKNYHGNGSAGGCSLREIADFLNKLKN